MGPSEPIDAWAGDALRDARVARLGTVDDGGAVRLVPVCFAVVDGWIVSAVDHKPKRTGQLRRLDDMRASGAATLLVDHYDDDWSTLWWVRVRGRAEVLDGTGPARDAALDELVSKYPQYVEHRPAGAVWRIAMDEVRWWRAAG
jgi:PPOX class probable F420-dependent enzyme